MISIELLRGQRLFADLPQDLLEECCKDIHLLDFQKKERVLQKGSPADALLLLFTGRLQVVSISEGGREVGIGFIEEGDYFGEIGLIDGKSRSASVLAVAPSAVGLMSKSKAIWLFQNNPVIAERIQRRLCAIIRKEINYRSNLGNLPAFSRVYAVVFSNTAAPPKPGERPLVIDNLPSQQSIASMANVSRETVSRAIHALIKSGIIQKDTSRLIVRDATLLAKLSSGEIEPMDFVTRRVVRQRRGVVLGDR